MSHAVRLRIATLAGCLMAAILWCRNGNAEALYVLTASTLAHDTAAANDIKSLDVSSADMHSVLIVASTSRSDAQRWPALFDSDQRNYSVVNWNDAGPECTSAGWAALATSSRNPGAISAWAVACGKRSPEEAAAQALETCKARDA